MHRRIRGPLILFLLGVSVALAQAPPVARISALASGTLLLDGKAASVADIGAAFGRLKQENGAVWYFRENPRSEPTEEALSVMRLITEHGLPVSLSSRSDFSDYIDEEGRSRPRQP